MANQPQQQPVPAPAPVPVPGLAPAPAAAPRRPHPQFTAEQRMFIYNLKLKQNKYPAIRLAWQIQFNTPPPSKRSIYYIVKRVGENYTAHNLNAGRSGRTSSECSDENVFAVMGSCMETPRLGTRKRAPGLGVSRSTLQRILKILNLKPYHITCKQQLQQADPQTRVDFANWYLGQLRLDPSFEDQIWWSDEAHCHLNGYINSHNAIHWGSERPTDVSQKPLHPIKVTVWCAISSFGILGPYFFENNGRTVTVNGTRYLHMLQNDFSPDLTRFFINNTDQDPNDCTFMQDGAPAHTTLRVRAFLRGVFGPRTIGYRLNQHWPARSPDLTPCDFFLWGYVKDELYKRYPLTGRHALKTAITDIITNMNQTFITNACQSVKRRCTQLLATQGHHFEQLR